MHIQDYGSIPTVPSGAEILQVSLWHQKRCSRNHIF